MSSSAISRLCWYGVIQRQTRPAGELDSFPTRSIEEQRRILATRLLDQVQYFGRRDDALPEWRDAAAVTDPDELWRHWRSLPILSKQLLRARFDPLTMQTRFALRGRANATGGSTGEPTRVFLDEAAVMAAGATQIYAQRRMGWRPGMPIVKVWGSDRDIGRSQHLRARVAQRLLRTFIVDGFALSDHSVDRVLTLIRRYRPVALSGYSSMLEHLARRVIERGDVLPPGTVHTAWNGGEMLYPEQVEIFQRAFGVPILNCYGGRELSVMAFQEREGQPLRVLRPWLFAEIVDERGEPVSSGMPGRLLWTSTVCRGTPFLRYDIGDLAAAPSNEDASAGAATLVALHGRTAGLLTLPSGKTINNIFWNHFFKEFGAVREFQVVVRGAAPLEIRLAGTPLGADDEHRMRSALAAFLERVPFVIRWLPHIPLGPQGKRVQVINASADSSEMRQTPEVVTGK